jgi:light-harvesting protein B-800-850 alpha chain
MNNSKIWLVVKPSVGVPIFLSAVAIGSFAVHVAVLTNTTWLGNFLRGTALTAPRASLAPTTNTAAVTFENSSEATVRLPDGRVARVTFDAPATTASIASPNVTR